ncbi:MAG: zinc-binding alcohol dehydrogenase [Planctomycetota bacterium]|nr:zinc-binding alcohol dehydrogenase [Planctomycetota bacterium]
MSLPAESLNIVFADKEQAELRAEPLRPPGKGELLVRATWTLVSTGTETICYGRRFEAGTHWDKWVKYPFHPGYSFVGVVEAVGEGVEGFHIGERVSSTHGHRQFAVGPVKDWIKVPDGVADRDAAWLTLSYIVQNGVRRAQHALGEDIVIVGLGPLGQLATQFVRLLGPRELIAIDPVPERLEMARRHGATFAINLDVKAAQEPVKELTEGRLADAVYDITGNDKVFQAAQQLLRKFGKLVLIGDTGTPSGQHLTGEVISKSLSILGSHATNTPPEETDFTPWTRQHMVRLFYQFLKDGRMRMTDLNTHVFAPKDAQAAYQKLLHDRARTMGCHFEWKA